MSMVLADATPLSESELEDKRKHYPPSLLKAVADPYVYVLKLRTGELIEFREAQIYGDYARLLGEGEDLRFESASATHEARYFEIDRGIDVRIEDIVWCADQGSD